MQQNVQKNLNCPVKGSLKEIEYFTCPEYRRRILLIKDKFDEPAVLTLYVGHPPCTDFTGAGIADLIVNYLVKEVGLTKEFILAALRNCAYDGECLTLKVCGLWSLKIELE